MKLLDILASEMKDWPSTRTGAVGQSESGSLHLNQDARHGSDFFGWTTFKFKMAEDWKTAWVTRTQWQAAVDALNAPKVVEWPEGATHKFSEPTTSPWRDLSGATWKWFESGIWRDSGRTSESLMANQPHRLTKLPIPEKETSMIDLVVEWDGVGLPPVGTVCQYQNSLGSWFKVEITAIAKKGICFIQPDLDGENYACKVSSKFRPIRTAEQVAAEERDKAINEMVFGVCGCEPDGGNTTAFMICGFIYDAGYRKEPKPCGS